MTLMVTEKCSWPQGKAFNKLCGDLSLTLMGKTNKSSREYSSDLVSDDRHAVEAVGESKGFVTQGHSKSEDSCVRKRRCISLNADKSDGFFVSMQVISLSNMSGFEKKNLEMRLRRELELVQKFQKKILSATTLKAFGIIVSSSGDPLIQKLDRAGQNIPQSNCGISGRFESTKQGPSPPSVTVLMKQCETLLKRLMAHQYAWIFNTPVDVVKLNIPDYFTVIKQPMDLGTVKSKVASGAYSSPRDFATDVRLTFSNAMTYNPPTNDVYAMANVMRKFFEMRWKHIEKKVAAADMAIQRETKVVKSTSESLKWKIPPVDHTVVLDSKPKMTDDEKLNLSRRLSSIPELPQHIIDFLKQHTDNAVQDSEDEIEIDFDLLRIEALLQLKKLLDDYAQENNLEQLKKTDPCEMEILIESGLSNSSMQPCKGNFLADVDEDLDICGNEPPITSYSYVDRGKNALPRSSSGSSSNSSSNESGSSSSESDSCSTFRSGSNIKVPRCLNPIKETERLKVPLRREQGHVIVLDQAEQNAHRKAVSVASNGNQEEENAPSERQVSPDKLYRAALLRSRFADTILKAREKTLDKGEKRDPEKMRQEREELEKQQREERGRLQAEAKAAEDARLKAEAEAAAEAKRRLEHEREAARQALLQMEKTVEINESSLFLKDLEMLGTAPVEHVPGSAIDINPDVSNEGIIDGFKFSGSNPLEQLGLFIKDDDDDDDEGGDDGTISPSK